MNSTGTPLRGDERLYAMPDTVTDTDLLLTRPRLDHPGSSPRVVTRPRYLPAPRSSAAAPLLSNPTTCCVDTWPNTACHKPSTGRDGSCVAGGPAGASDETVRGDQEL